MPRDKKTTVWDRDRYTYSTTLVDASGIELVDATGDNLIISGGGVISRRINTQWT